MRGPRLFITTSIVYLVILNSVYAQELTSNGFPRIGVGMAIVDSRGNLPGLSPTILTPSIFTVPIDISKKFRVEPEIGFYRFSDESERTITTRRGGYFAVGLFPTIRRGKLNMYFGIRVGLISGTYVYEHKISQYPTPPNRTFMTGSSFAPAIGGEYLISSRFSLGGECQLRLLSSEGENEYVGLRKESVSESVTATRALLFMRFYF